LTIKSGFISNVSLSLLSRQCVYNAVHHQARGALCRQEKLLSIEHLIIGHLRVANVNTCHRSNAVVNKHVRAHMQSARSIAMATAIGQGLGSIV
jgi:hypothetical protein